MLGAYIIAGSVRYRLYWSPERGAGTSEGISDTSE